MDEHSRNPGLSRFVPRALEPGYQADLFARFGLDQTADGSLSKGQRTQVALIAAVCPETDLLVLDEPTSGLDPIVRREFIEAVIGAYQQGRPGERTILCLHT